MGRRSDRLGGDGRSRSERWGLYRNTKGGWIAGVCAGIADRLEVKPVWVRIVFVLLATISHGILAIILYVVAVALLEPRSVPIGYAAAPYPAGSPGYFADRFYPGAAATGPQPPPYTPPSGQRLADIAARFAALDSRLNNIEAAVMSDELSLRRKFRDLGG
jgi:phage shock protein C